MKPKVTISGGAQDGGSKEIEGLIPAAFWIGIEHSSLEADLRVSVSCELGHEEDPELTELVSLLARRGISFSVDFGSARPRQEVPRAHVGTTVPAQVLWRSHGAMAAGYEEELEELRRTFERGGLTRKQYDSNRQVLISEWKRKVQGGPD